MSHIRKWKSFTFIIFLLQAANISADFNDLFQADWAPDHITSDGDRVSLSLDSSTGCGFESKKKYPKSQAMGIYASLWNADDWATQGGRVKTNWTHAPFVVTFEMLEIDACDLSTDEAADKCGKSGQFWWDKPVVKEESRKRRKQLKWVRDNYLVYDYCQDVDRFSQALPEN